MKHTQLLKKAEENGLFEDLVCPKCEGENKIDFREEKKNASGVWYYCQHCDWLDVIGWDIVEEVAQQK